MILFDDENLFDSGPNRLTPGGLSLRHVLHETPGADGVQLTAHGRPGRAITQTGELMADDAAAMQSLTEAIEGKLDGQAHTLADTDGPTWPDVVMLSFEPQAVTRIGARVRLGYTIHYLQVNP
jgi:hypothetical protein